MVCVPNPDSGSLSKHLARGCRPLGQASNRMLVAGFLAPAAWLLAGCGSGGDLISTVALPTQQSTADAEGLDVSASSDGGPLSATPDVTPAQREYLDALLAAGVHPSNDLRALSIGSYVCQARAAGQSDQTVWDSVAPMVRSDIADAHTASLQAPSAADSDAVIGHYIGVATQRLC